MFGEGNGLSSGAFWADCLSALIFFNGIYAQMKSVAATLLRNFKLNLVSGHPIGYSMSLTLFMRNGLLVNVEAR